jgi:anaerobic selenocysteine-containing dehydrogenase
VIAQDLLDNESVRLADIVLPATATYERDGTLTNWEARRQRFEGSVTSPTLALDDWDVISQLALRLGADLGFRDLDGIRREMAEIGQHPAAHPWSERDWRRPQSGISKRYSQYEDLLTLWSYPLLLDLGTMSVGADDMLRTAKRPFAALNTEDAERLGIEDGQPVVVSNERSSVAVPARVEDDVAPGTVFLPSNSTEVPAASFTGDEDGPVRVSIEPAPEMLGSVLPDRGGWVHGDAGLTHPGADR